MSERLLGLALVAEEAENLQLTAKRCTSPTALHP